MLQGQTLTDTQTCLDVRLFTKMQANGEIEMKINTKVLQAAMLCAEKNDMRYYLNGVLIDFKNKRIATTNGHVLFVSHDAFEIEEFEQSEIIVPYSTMDFIVKSAVKLKSEFVEVEIHDKLTEESSDYIYTISAKDDDPMFGCETIEVFKPINGKFPNIMNVLSKWENKDTKDVGFCGAYLKLINKVSKVLKCQYPHIQLGGRDGALMINFKEFGNSDLYVMPARTEK